VVLTHQRYRETDGQTDRQEDGQTDERHAVSIPHFALYCIPIQYEHAPLRVCYAMLRKHPPVDPVLSCLSCFRKTSVGVCQVVSNSPDPGIAWPSTRFRPDLWRWFEEDTASIRRLIHSGLYGQTGEAMGLDNRGKWRLLSGMTDIFIPHEIRPFEAKDSLQAPLVQHVNSKYVHSKN